MDSIQRTALFERRSEPFIIPQELLRHVEEAISAKLFSDEYDSRVDVAALTEPDEALSRFDGLDRRSDLDIVEVMAIELDEETYHIETSVQDKLLCGALEALISGRFRMSG